MQISWGKPHYDKNKVGGPNLPKKILIPLGNREVILSPAEINYCTKFLERDFGLDNDDFFIHSLFSEDGSFGFCIIIDTKNRHLYIPPGGMTTNSSIKGGGGKLQNLFEQIASKNGYTLYVCISASKMHGFSQRVTDVLRKEGYFLGKPGDTHRYGIHQSTYDYNGLPNLGIDHANMQQPTSMN